MSTSTEKPIVNITCDDQEYILRFPYDNSILTVVRTLPGRQYLPEKKVWRIPAQPGTSALLEQKLHSVAHLVFSGDSPKGLSEAEALRKYTLYLKRKRYSPNTIKNYTHHLSQFLQYSGVDHELSDEKIISYFDFLVAEKKVSAAYQHMAANAVKSYITSILGKSMPRLSIRPKREKHLPVVLSVEEVSAIIREIQNLKHKTAITLIYSAGLRISEAVNLKLDDIDIDRGVIIIKQSKGRKDRQVPLSKKFRLLYSEYIGEYSPKIYLFEGQKGGKYSVQTS